MDGYSQPSEFWLGLALLIATTAAIVSAAFNFRSDARLDFFQRLIASTSSAGALPENNSEASAVEAKDNT